jgi:CubicO group peptidase (beta-lactamase class C family)
MVEGHVAAGFEPVRDVFADVVREQGGPGAGVAAWHDGRWVVDLAGGGWSHESLVMPYSVSKPFAALPALVLVDRGVLDLDAAMQRYWPEFTAAATLRQVLSHQSGIVGLDAPASTEVFYDWNDACARLASQEPLWMPGSAHGECALFYGHLVGEPVHRVDGRSPGTFLREEVTDPLGIAFWFGLPRREQHRAVALDGFEAPASQRAGKPELYARAVDNPPGAFDPSVVNGARWRAAEIPAVNGFATARGIAQMYVDLVAGRILSSGLVREMTTAHSVGADRVFGQEVSWGLGVAVDAADGFGMGGTGGHYGGWSAVGGYAMAFVTGLMGSHERADRVETALRQVIGAPPL